MPINVLRKKGAKMSLHEAHERVEKLKRLSQSSNPHEAALAASRLQAFDVNIARAPQKEIVTPNASATYPSKTIDVLDAFPDHPYHDLGEIEVMQDPEKKKVNWDELHFELLERAQSIGADALINIQLQGTPNQKILRGLALHYLTPQEMLSIQAANKLEEDEKAYVQAQKERRDEDTAPGIG